MSDKTKFVLDESKLPKAWYNINADMPVPPEPVLHPRHAGAGDARFPERALPDER